jgi:hypothetical protein
VCVVFFIKNRLWGATTFYGGNIALDALVEAPPGNGEFVVAHKCFQQELLLN